MDETKDLLDLTDASNLIRSEIKRLRNYDRMEKLLETVQYHQNRLPQLQVSTKQAEDQLTEILVKLDNLKLKLVDEADQAARKVVEISQRVTQAQYDAELAVNEYSKRATDKKNELKDAEVALGERSRQLLDQFNQDKARLEVEYKLRTQEQLDALTMYKDQLQLAKKAYEDFVGSFPHPK